ncbi:hypothetical protein MPTK1_3g12320 [Marchantia polymorpha subsp. ruderalis]|uniref:ER-bound oxygenase mpaB/mpaB'/Rubber oxygenase catalytic domain-containing protein n=2 Tax=Marchantia polymorpha TaxID=3197 RepID=A0AAF6B017_MARPO|nr:hypothetical protein MARPO_0050s0036 [Marchantia polymorpha]BBN05351.1 hypothetical protein Mp_3g12320 [Marchantia polymorpha subsp. ruderalis]|eukprot:PTQ38572.1 hypothetical protein MARPO_0050s0036 [Marchantia polymorpha]
MHMKETDLPSNQEHLLYTLCEFSIVIITNLRKMGINPTPNEVTAYLHLWHVIGYYLGVTEEFSKRIVSENGAAALFVEMEKDLVHPGEAGKEAAKALLGNMALRPPMFWPYNLHGAVMRKLVGDEITSSLGIEPTPWYWKMIASGVLFNVRLLHSSNLFVRPRIYLYRKFTPPLWVVLSWIGKRISSRKGESEEKGGCQFERPRLGPDTSKKY